MTINKLKFNLLVKDTYSTYDLFYNLQFKAKTHCFLLVTTTLTKPAKPLKLTLNKSVDICMNYSYRLFSVTMWMSYLKRGWAGRDIPRKSTWGKVEYKVKESQSSTLSQGAELLPQSSHGETEGRGHLRAHTHTHICLMGECCVCEVGLAWGVGGKKKSLGGRGVGRNFERKCCFQLRSHPFFTSLCTHDMLVAWAQAPVVYPQAYPKTICLPGNRHARLWGFGHTSLLIFSTQFLLWLYFSYLFRVIPFFLFHRRWKERRMKHLN